ncbi:hypothetical protein GCM10007913_27810 [Devosia yakushimensis]|uniref:Uncharacterized protein n=1 Tax=Devosia yakushimensis TaxID=470028 RepID=A0ABQ5UFJ6_9HYPH|nr:hypothetical protein GCM10007913_27810 [Devosia yakushimensis]
MGDLTIGVGASPHPLPTSPIKGEVPLCGWDVMLRKTPSSTLPLVGRVGEGDGWPQCTGENFDVW